MPNHSNLLNHLFKYLQLIFSKNTGIWISLLSSCVGYLMPNPTIKKKEKSMFYLTLPSNSSADHFPDNTVSDYISKLPKEINLDGSWEIGVAEVLYSRNWFTIPSSGQYWVYYKTPEAFVNFNLPIGYYKNARQLVKDLMTCLKQELGEIEPKVQITINGYRNFVRIILERTFTGVFLLGSDLQKMLGISLPSKINGPGKFYGDEINRHSKRFSLNLFVF